MSEEKFSRAFRSCSDAIAITRVEDGRFLEVSDSFVRLSGWEREEAIGRTAIELNIWVHPEQREQLVQSLRSQGSVRELEFQFRKKSGARCLAMLSAELLKLEGEEYMVGVVRDVTQQRRAERHLREISARLIQLQELERRRLARELHDSTAQTLAALAISLSTLESMTGLRSRRAKAVLHDCQQLTSSSLRELRTLTCLLHPPDLEERGLGGPIPLLAESFQARSGIRVELNLPDALPRFSTEYELTMYRIVQKCLSNIHRHSGSAAACIEIALSPTMLVLTVMDFGCGFATEEVPDEPLWLPVGVGIQGMHERVRQLGGNLEITSGEGGTTVRAELPLMQEMSKAASLGSPG